MIAFLFAMEKETTLLKKESELLFAKEHMGATYELRRKDKTPFLLVVSGIGKTLSAGALSALPLLFDGVDSLALLNAGVSASLDPKALPTLSFFIPEAFANHDIDTTAFGDPLGLFFRPNEVFFEADPELRKRLLKAVPEAVKKGNEASGDVFVEGEEKIHFIREKFGALGCDMESGSEAAIAENLKLPFASLRIVSDGASKEEYESNFEKARRLLTNALWKVLSY